MLTIIGFVAPVFVVLNLCLFVAYKGRTYPNAKIQSKPVGSVAAGALQSKIGNLELLPKQLTFAYKDKKAEVATNDLGITVDAEQTARAAIRTKAWLPIANFFVSKNTEPTISFDAQKLTDETTRLEGTFKQDPIDARITLDNGNFTLVSETDGYSLDESAIKDAVQDAIGQGQQTVTVPVRTAAPKIKQADLASNANDLKERQNLSLQLRFGDKTHKITAAEVADVHSADGATFVLNDTRIRELVIKVGREFGIGVLNLSEVMSAAKNSLELKKPLDFTLKEAPLKTYTYCTATRGVSTSELPTLEAKLVAVLADRRGWSAEGKIGFSKVDSGCNFRVWLTAADQMSSFGAICDSLWSCAVSPNVVINYDRWRFASTAWNNASGSLEDYRAMVINHETGHWLGFGHKNCPGAGQAAPVMQQQSIDLQGCTFNPWPLVSEITALKTRIGI